MMKNFHLRNPELILVGVMLLIFIILLLTSCEQQKPTITSTGQPVASPTMTETIQNEPPSIASDSPQSSATASASPSGSVAIIIPQFANPEAVRGAQDYVAAFAELKNQPPPPASVNQDAVSNPASVTGSLNLLAAKLNALSRAKQQVEANLTTPEELKRWQQLEKTVGQP